MKKLVFIILGIIIFSNCSKYEEGPFLTLLSKEKRLLRTWISKELLFDYDNNDTQIDYTGRYYCDSAIKDYTKSKIKKEYTFHSGGTLDYIEYAEFYALNLIDANECKIKEDLLVIDTFRHTGKWEFTRNKQMLKIVIDDEPFICDSCHEWQIVKLSTKELKLRKEDLVYTPTEENFVAK